MPLNALDPMNQVAPDMNTSDFSNLARIAQPVMQPNAPLGAGWTAGADFAQQKQRQADLIAQATQQAQKEAMLKASQADEYQAGAPGRMSEINTGNINAAAGQQAAQQMSDSGLTVSAKIAKSMAGLSEDKQKEVESKSAMWNQLAGAQGDPQKIKMILDAYGDQATLFGKPLNSSDPQQLSEMAEGLRKGIMENPKNATAMSIAAIKASAEVEASKVRGQNAAEIRANNDRVMQKFKLDNPANAAAVEGQLQHKLATSGFASFTGPEREAWDALQTDHALAAIARTNTAPGTTSVEGGKIINTPPPALPIPYAPKGNAPAPAPSASKSTAASWDITTAKANGATGKITDSQGNQIGWQINGGNSPSIYFNK